MNKRWLAILLLVGCLWGNLGFAIWQPATVPLAPVHWSPQVQWITSAQPSYRFYTRHTFYGPETVQAAWVRISADNDFVFNINGRQSVIRENGALNSPKGLTYRRKVPLQDFSDTLPYAAETGLNYALASSPDWKISVYLDLTNYVRPGKNVIAIEVMKGDPNPRIAIEGQVLPETDVTPIDLSTGATPWQVSTLAENRSAVRWFHLEFDDSQWPEAVPLGPVYETTYTRLSQRLFDRPVQGSWIATAGPWLYQTWQVPRRATRSLLRYAAVGEPAVFINGRLVDTQPFTQGKQLRMFDVTAYVKPGKNKVAVHLAQPVDNSWTRDTGEEPPSIFVDAWAESKQGDVPVPQPSESGWIRDIPNPALSVFVDAWAESSQGHVLSAIQTDGSWRGGDDWSGAHRIVPSPTVLVRQVMSQEFIHHFLGYPFLQCTGWYVSHQLLWWGLGCGLSISLAWGLGRLWLHRQENALAVGADLLLPSLVFLLGAVLLKHRHGEGMWAIWLEQSGGNLNWLLGSLLVLLLTLISWDCPRWQRYGLISGASVMGLGLLFSQSLSPGSIFLILGGLAAVVKWQLLARLEQLSCRLLAALETGPQWQRSAALGGILLLGFGLRVYRLTKENLDSDENTSYDATRGILRTGAPLATSGIWYTRGPIFHYLLALWLRLVGDSVFNARFFSVIIGTATLLLMFYITQRVTGRVWIALVVTLILALNPWEIWYSRFIRFYQMVQFTTLLTMWAFIRGFIDDQGRRHQYVFFVALAATLLIQEVSLTSTPGFLLGYLCFGPRFRWHRDWRLWLNTFMVMAIFAYDIIFFKIKCLTPWTALSSSTTSYLSPHLLDVTGFLACFFVGPNRLEILYTMFFFIGFVYFLRQQAGLVLFLFSFVCLNLLVLTLLTYQIAERYAYGVYPLFVMLAIYSAIAITQELIKTLRQGFPHWPVGVLVGLCLTLLLTSNLELGRIVHSYSQAMGRRNTAIFEYIRDHRQAGDVVISPTPSFGPVTIGPVDYFLMGTWFLDATYWRNGRLLDRWGGGVVVTNVDQLERVLETSQRVWVHIDDARQSRLSAQILEYVQTVGKPVYDSFGTSLRLWDPADGWLPHTPEQGKDLGAY
ncbi:glycosyltransferase family 39 protein [Leptolyngbya cf. ectocarpi LEGE 11479]|uniref:Glycosyltransferase family 39 protein n=1 Tax=Leptolyngbya cf. ectocarpi LEGE 11479 TaxID=1828722 RepID=A0A928ZS29_LEPEC|nr:glycosyltransferase family 39 protein [Leptolyngbya ectocarpi]MBE9065502.1 glycosyltransferase family 39 protein [Leptolyngbya cf. ectocarpi LEGE 11479]